MGSTWGNNLKLSLWGESHGKAVGIVADGFPHGFKIDFSRLESDMRKRRPRSKPRRRYLPFRS